MMLVDGGDDGCNDDWWQLAMINMGDDYMYNDDYDDDE